MLLYVSLHTSNNFKFKFINSNLPKKRFLSWDENISELVAPENDLSKGLVRLVGTDDEIGEKINSGKYFITNWKLLEEIIIISESLWKKIELI